MLEGRQLTLACQSGRGCDLFAAFGSTRPASPAARLGRFLRNLFHARLVGADRADRGRKECGDAKRLLRLVLLALLVFVAGGAALEAFAAGPLAIAALGPVAAVGALGPIGALLALGTLRSIGALLALPALGPVRTLLALGTRRAVVAVVALTALEAVTAILPRLALGAGLLLAAVLVALAVHHLVVAVIVVVVRRTLVLEPRAGLAQHPEIMVGELEVIFGLDPVASKLGVAGHVLVLLEKLRSVAANPLVTAVAAATAASTTETLRTLTPTTATAAVLAIVHQVRRSLTTSALVFLEARELSCRTATRSLSGAPSVVLPCAF
jgi:hypothetical protein